MYIRILPVSVALFLLAPTAWGQSAGKDVASSVSAATVFQYGAQVERIAKASIAAGPGTLVFTGLPQGLDPQSLHVSGKGAFNILSVAHRINYLSEGPRKKEVTELQASIKSKEHECNVEANNKAIWDQEEQLLLKNAAVGGQQNGVSASQLQAVNDYVRERLKVVKAGQLKQTELLATLNEDLAKLRQQLQQLQAQAARPTSEVVLEVEAASAGPAGFTISYFVPNASWTPGYDLRASGAGKPLDLTMKAQVVNNTGEDWEKVDLSLSSGNPTLGGVMPELSAWVLAQPMVVGGFRGGAYPMAPMAAKSESSGMNATTLDADAQVANTVVTRTTTMEFNIDAPFTIPADGQAHSVQVQRHSVPATFQYQCTPKLDRDAFLYARTTGWEDLDLLPGEANVFFEGTYVGKSYLALDQPKDTLDIPLGRDKGIIVERVKRKTTNDKALLGGKRTVTVGWDISIRNTKAVPVLLELHDQYPLSARSEVEVKLTDAGGAQVDDQNGMLTWKFTIAPKETKKAGFAYTVKYPKELPVVLE